MIIQFDKSTSKVAEKQVDSKTKITFHFNWCFLLQVNKIEESGSAG